MYIQDIENGQIVQCPGKFAVVSVESFVCTLNKPLYLLSISLLTFERLRFEDLLFNEIFFIW